MANAVYTISFTSTWGTTSYNDGDDYLLEIWSKAVNTNPAIPIKCSSTPLTINWRNVSDIFDPVITSEAVVEVISETDLYWKDFFTADRGDWILKVYRNGTTSNDIIWQGQNVTESYNEPYLGTPYKSILRFSDLGDMDFTYFQPTSTTFYSGYKSLAEIILTCTNKLQFNLDINEYTNTCNIQTWNDATITDKSLLCNTFLDVAVFRKYDDKAETVMTCMEVLKSVLKSIGCRMFQASGEGLKPTGWHIQRIEEMIGSDAITCFGIDHTTYLVTTSEYTQDLHRDITNGTNFTSPTLDITPVDQNQQLEVSERFNKLVYKYTTTELFRKDAEILLNGKFDKGTKSHNNTTKFPKYFQVSSDISSSNACQIVTGKTANDKDLLFRAYKQSPTLIPMPAMLAAQGTSISTITSTGAKYIRTTGTESGDTADMQTKVASNIQIGTQDNLKLTVKGNLLKVFDHSSAQSVGQNNEAYATAEVFHFCFKVVLTYDNGHKYCWWMNQTYPGYGQNKWTIWNGTAYTVGDNIIHRVIGTKGFNSSAYSGLKYYDDKFEIELDSAFFPENGIGSFSFYMYVPRTETPYPLINLPNQVPIGLAAVTLDSISLQYLTDGDFSDDVIRNVEYFTLTDAKDNIYEYDVMFGDGPTDIDVSSFRYGVVSAADQYKITSTWTKLSSLLSLNAFEIFVKYPCQKLISSYQRVISGDYIGMFDILNTLDIDDGVDNKRYLIMGDSWNVKANIHSLVMREITENTITTTNDSYARTFNSQPVPSNSAIVTTKKSSLFSGKAINSAVVLNQPSTFSLKQNQTTYPG